GDPHGADRGVRVRGRHAPHAGALLCRWNPELEGAEPMRLHHHVAAAALAGTLLAGLPSARADTTIDPQMLDIISELSGVPQEELARDRDRWREVAALLQRYLAEAGGQPAAAGTTPLPGAYPFPATFRQ